jgi:hypothetical protein
MTELSIDVSKLPTISDTNSWYTSCNVFMNGVEQTYTDSKIVLRAWWRDYRNWIIFGLTLLAVGAIILLVTLLPSSTPSYPCRMYDTETLASTISVDCLQYVWDGSCRTKQPYLFPQSYTGWWKQSPQGGTMVSCRMSPSSCGVGSYGNIIVYMQFCQIKYNQ